MGYIPLLVDPGLKYLKEYKADVVVDAILAKKILGTTIDAAEFVIGVRTWIYRWKRLPRSSGDYERT